jgi:O-glycosyl hydrolase
MGASTINQTIPIQNASGVTSMMPIQTSSNRQQTQLSPVSVANNTFTYALPPQSVTIFEQFP